MQRRHKRGTHNGNARRRPNSARIDGVAHRLLRLIWIFGSRVEATSFRDLCDEFPDLYPAVNQRIRTFERDKAELKALGFRLGYGPRQDVGYAFERSGLTKAARRLPASTFPAIRAIATMLETPDQFMDRAELLLALAKLGGLRPGLLESASSTSDRIKFRYPTDTHAFIAANMRVVETAIRCNELVTFLHETLGGQVEHVSLEPLATTTPFHVIGKVVGGGLRIFRLINLHGIKPTKRPADFRAYVLTPEELLRLKDVPSWRFPTHEEKPIVLEVDRSIAELADEVFSDAEKADNEDSQEQWLRYALNSANHEAVYEWALMMGGELCRVMGPPEAQDHMRFLLTERQASPVNTDDHPSNRRGKAAMPMPSGPTNVRDVVTLAVLCAHNPGVSLDDAARWLGQPVESVQKLLRELSDAAAEEPAFRFTIESSRKHGLVPYNADGLMRVLHLSDGEIVALTAAIELVETSGLDEFRASAAELRRWIQDRDPSNSSHIGQTVVHEPDPDDKYVVEMVRVLASCAARGEEVRISHFDADTLERQICLLVPKCVTSSGGGWTVFGRGLDDDATFEILLGIDATVATTGRKSMEPVSFPVSDGCDAMESETVSADDLPFGRVQFKAPLADIIPRAWLPGIGRRAADGSVTVNHRYYSRHFFFAMLRRYGSAAELIGPADLRREYLHSLHRIRSYYEPRPE